MPAVWGVDITEELGILLTKPGDDLPAIVSLIDGLDLDIEKDQATREQQAIIAKYSAQLEQICPYLNDLMAMLQGADAATQVIHIAFQDNGGAVSHHIVVGFGFLSFPLEIGRSSLPAEFVKQADWIRWDEPY